MFFGKVPAERSGRIPPDQNVTTTWPVLHHGSVPKYKKDLSDWDLKIFGLVQHPVTYTYDDFFQFPQIESTNDIHCVTGWSKLDNVWKGVAVKEILKDVEIKSEAKYVILHAEEGWTANLPLNDFMKETSLLAYAHNGEVLTSEHGYPLRVIIPHLYFWKSAKWLRAIELVEEDQAGFWERNGYHMYGDPWLSQRTQYD